MQSVDGDVRLSVTLGTKTIRQSLTEMKRTFLKAMGYASESADAVSSKYMQLQNNVQKTAEKIKLAKLKLQEFQNQPLKATRECGSLIKEFDKIGEEILKVNNLKKAFKEDYGLGAEQLSGYKELNSQMGLLIAKYERLKKKREEAEQSGTAFKSNEAKYQSLVNSLQAAEREYDIAIAKANEFSAFEDFNRNAKNSGNKIKDVIKNAFSGLSGSIKGIGKSGAKSIGNINKSVKKGLGTVLKYALSLRILHDAFRKLVSYSKEGFEKLAVYSDDVNATISGMLSSLEQFKNQAAAAFQPLLTSAAPIVNTFISVINNALFAVSQFFAALTGQDYVYKAIKTEIDYAAGLHETAEEAENAKKALQDYLSPLDEINRYTSDQGNKNIGANQGPAFEVTPIEQEFKTLADKIKDYFGDFFEPFRASWSNKGSAVMEAWHNALERIKGALSDIGEDFKAVWTNGSGEKFVDKLLESAELLGKGVDAFVGAFQAAWNKDDLGQSVIQSMIDQATAFLDLINTIGRDLIDVWNAGYGERIWSNILKIVKNINEILGGFYVKLKKAWDKNEKGKKIWETILSIIEEVTDFFRELSEITVEWVDDLDFNPLLEGILSLLEGFKKLLKVLNGKFKTVYEKILLPLAKWTIEKAVPKLLEAMGNALEFIADVIDDIPESVLIGLASAIAGLGTAVLVFKGGQAIASGISAVAGALKLFLSTVAAHPILVLAGAIAGVTAAIIAYNELQWGNTGIQEFYDEVEKYSDDMAKISENMNTVLNNTDKTLSNTFADTKYLETYADRLKEIIEDGQITPEEEAEFRTIDKVFEDRLEGYKKQIGLYITENESGVLKITGKISEIGTALDEVIDKYKQTALTSVYSSLIEDAYKTIITGQDEYNKLLEENSDMLGAGKDYVEAMTELRQLYQSAYGFDRDEYGRIKEATEEQKQAAIELGEKYDGLSEKALNAAKKLHDLGYSTGDIISTLETNNLSKIFAVHDNAPIRFLEELSPKVQEAIGQTETAKAKTDEATEALNGLENALSYLEGNIEGNYVGAFELYRRNLITTDDVTKDLGISIEELEKKAGEQGLTGTLAKSTDSINADMDSIESSTGKAAEAISDLETETETPLSNTEDNIESLATTTETSMSNVVNAITTAVQDSIKRLRELQEEAEKTGDKVSPIGAAGGALAGIAALQPKRSRIIPQSASAIPIPKLAQGAVIPANREFVAMLGDQRNGTNLEAPESLIRKIFREETAATGGGANNYQFTAQINRRTLFDEMITEAKLRRVINNKNPFDLG